MITDPMILADVRQQWQVVLKLAKGERSYFTEGVQITETWPKEAFNLPFLLAYAVLDQVLSHLKDQGAFPCPPNEWRLFNKLEASKHYLPWQNYGLIDLGRKARNDLAHEAKVLGKADCKTIIKAVEMELVAWAILPAAVH
jgi:hypothetical protein